MKSNVKPGDVVIGGFACKARPWLVLWVDYSRGEVCLIAITSKTRYLGATETGHPRYTHAGAWASLQPLHVVNKLTRAGHSFDAEQRARVGAAIAASLSLTPGEASGT